MSTLVEMQERYRRNDPLLNQITWNPGNLGSCQKIVEALENNTVVDDIFVLLCPSTLLDVQNHAPVLYVIRTRSQLRKFSVMEVAPQVDHNLPPQDVSEILNAAAQNPALQHLILSGRSVVSPSESLGTFRSHPNLQELHLSMDTEFWNQRNSEMVQQIIKTCPKIDRLLISGGNFTRESWDPICQALSKIQPQVNLDLRSCKFDATATLILQKFLHSSPNSIHLHVNPYTVKFPQNSTILSRMEMIGPSVTTLEVSLQGNLLETQNQMIRCLKTHNNFIMLKAIVIHFETFFSTNSVLEKAFREMPELILLKKITIRIPTRDWHNVPKMLRFKSRMMDALKQNFSIREFCFFREWTKEELGWSDSEQEKLQCYRQRNQCISALIVAGTPVSSPFFLLPNLFQSCPCNRMGATIIFSILRNGLDCDGFIYST